MAGLNTMTPETRAFYRTLSRKAGAVASAAMALACDCRSSDGDRVIEPAKVRSRLLEAHHELEAFWAREVGEDGAWKR